MRLALVPPSKLTSEQLPLYEDMKAGISAKYSAFTGMRDDGRIWGLGARGYTIPNSVLPSGASPKR
jgi:hypothetical protein